MASFVKRQPVITVGVVVTLCGALIAFTNAFGLTTITDAQRDALIAAVVAMWPLLAVIWSVVTPAAAPALPEGTTVRLPDGTDGTVSRQ